MKETDYRNLILSNKNVDTYFPLYQKVKVVEYVSEKYFYGNLLDVGCGRMPYKPLILEKSKISKYDGVDIENEIYQKEIKPDFFWDGKILPFESGTYQCAQLIEVLEHVPEPKNVLGEIRKVLVNDGILLITVPFLWNLHDVPYDEYRYTPFALNRILQEAGYEVIEMEAFGGWHASMAAMLALYARRGIFGRKRKIITVLLMPIIKYLYKKDTRVNKSKFTNGMMITGLWCIARAKK
ncbi:MAG: SAM-dependent methyltransferase [Pusillimonas sp.]|nr:SAM-dependent methyltransferase [Pusillimonas sp.]|tara:strand:- start:8390 stop:9103 length:714 start_codon:yes stop_codon:yes gene_type:complete